MNAMESKICERCCDYFSRKIGSEVLECLDCKKEKDRDKMNQRTQDKYKRLIQERDQILYYIDCSEAPTASENKALLSINRKISNLKKQMAAREIQE